MAPKWGTQLSPMKTKRHACFTNGAEIGFPVVVCVSNPAFRHIDRKYRLPGLSIGRIKLCKCSNY